jgi:hypothetical protein
MECDLEGKILWRYCHSDMINAAVYLGLRPLLNGNTLVSTGSTTFEIARGGIKVGLHKVERTPALAADIHRPVYPFRLDKDRWLYGLYEKNACQALRIFDDRGRPLKEIFPPVDLRPQKAGTQLQYIENGRLFFISPKTNSIIEVDSRGKLVWTYKEEFGDSPSLTPLRNGHILLAYRRKDVLGNRLVEVDLAGKVLWERNCEYLGNRSRTCFDILRLGFD